MAIHVAVATAVTCQGVSLTYTQLNAQADSLAARLRASGLHTGQPVALFMNRSIEAIVAIIATLKAGGGYVPIDPDFHARRLPDRAPAAGGTEDPDVDRVAVDKLEAQFAP